MVVITGASSGIGAATACACGAEGMHVALAARREAVLREVASAVETAGGEAFVYPADVTDVAQVEALIAATVGRFERLDVLVANAGLGYSGPMECVTDEQMARLVHVNLLGVMRCVRAALPVMLSQGSGHVITVSSVAAGIALPRAAIYAATKAGVHRFTEGLRREVGRHGIDVTDVLPGIIDTPMTQNLRGIPKAAVAGVARAIVGVMRRPRRSVVTPAWYHAVLAANHVFPGIVDAVLAVQSRDSNQE